MEPLELLFLVAPAAALLALFFAFLFARRVLKTKEAAECKEIASIIRKGANAFLKRQYIVVSIFFGAVFLILVLLAYIPMAIKGAVKLIDEYMPFAFLTGGIFSGLSGYLGMKIATIANSRTATASKESLNSGLKVAFSAGSVMGLVVVGLGLLDLSIWYTTLIGFYKIFHPQNLSQAQFITTHMINFGIGASFMALFARVGGGIFTKAADVGADLVGKVEENIPEDDARNPAVIADNVGDNVGDVAGMGADLYESYVGSLLSAMALGVSALKSFWGAIIPLLIAATGVVFSILGTFLVKTKEGASQASLLKTLRLGTWFAAAATGILSVVFLLIIGFTANNESIKNFVLRAIGPVLIGLVAGVAIGFFTEYFTSASYRPTKKLAESTESGAAPVIINGTALGMLSTIAPVVIIAITILASFFIMGGDLQNNINSGLFGVGIAAVGMLSTLGITLSTDAYGPVADNAGGIAEMSGMGSEVRKRTDALDALGNTTAATGKGFAIGSAMLTAIALLSAFVVQVQTYAQSANINFKLELGLRNPFVLVGFFIGAALPFIFSALTMSSVGKSSQSVVQEVRRQFRETPGLREGITKPDYARCVDICTTSAQKQMILPAVIAILSPICFGFVIGINGVAALLLGTTISGFLLAVFMSASGGAWDNAKKYIEEGHLGGKGSKNHSAAVIGDTVGDPFKDTSGPSLNILLKLISVVAIVFVPVIMLSNNYLPF